MDNQGDPLSSPFVRAEGNTALEQVTGQKFGYKQSNDAMRTRDETAVYRKWRSWWPQAYREWEAAQEKTLAERAAVLEKLEKVQQGTDPEAPPKEEKG